VRPYLEKTLHKKRAGGMAQGEGPEFKPQYSKKKKTMTSQGNTEQKEQRWRYHSTLLQTILQTYSNKNSMVLA
jgi:hypothetical protein